MMPLHNTPLQQHCEILTSPYYWRLPWQTRKIFDDYPNSPLCTNELVKNIHYFLIHLAPMGYELKIHTTTPPIVEIGDSPDSREGWKISYG